MTSASRRHLRRPGQLDARRARLLPACAAPLRPTAQLELTVTALRARVADLEQMLAEATPAAATAARRRDRLAEAFARALAGR